MTSKQISVFLENKPGQLIDFARLLEQNQINMHAMCVADAKDFGILRIIVNDPYKTACVLKEAGYVCSITPVLALQMPDKPGSLVRVLELLGEGGVNVEYTYAFTSKRPGYAYMIFRVGDAEKAAAELEKQGIALICQSELAELFDR